MHLLDFTPTGVVPPAIRIVEADEDPYALEKEDPITRWEWIKTKRDATRENQRIVDGQVNRLRMLLNAKYGLQNYMVPVTTWDRADGPLIMEPSLRIHKEYQAKVGNDPLYPRLITLAKRSYQLQQLVNHYNKMDSTAEAAKTRKHKSEKEKRAQQQANIIVPTAMNPIIVGKNSFHNPYYSKLTGNQVAKGQVLTKVAVPAYQFQFPRGTIYGKWFAEITAVLDRNNKEWSYAYGYYILRKKSILAGQTTPDMVGFAFLTKDKSFVMAKDKVYNTIGERELYKFIQMPPKEQDDFVKGLIA